MHLAWNLKSFHMKSSLSSSLSLIHTKGEVIILIVLALFYSKFPVHYAPNFMHYSHNILKIIVKNPVTFVYYNIRVTNPTH